MDVDKHRAETPGAERVVHLNNCGASLMPQPVLDAVINHLRLEAEIGGYEAEAEAALLVGRVFDIFSVPVLFATKHPVRRAGA